MESRVSEILNYVPKHLQTILSGTFAVSGESIQEIRVRNGMPLIVSTINGSFAVLPDGSLSPAVGGAYVTTEADLRQIFQAICENSVYAYLVYER